MTTHELAQYLLTLDNVPVLVRDNIMRSELLDADTDDITAVYNVDVRRWCQEEGIYKVYRVSGVVIEG